jgi:hypothetical protein
MGTREVRFIGLAESTLQRVESPPEMFVHTGAHALIGCEPLSVGIAKHDARSLWKLEWLALDGPTVTRQGSLRLGEAARTIHEKTATGLEVIREDYQRGFPGHADGGYPGVAVSNPPEELTRKSLGIEADRRRDVRGREIQVVE